MAARTWRFSRTVRHRGLTAAGIVVALATFSACTSPPQTAPTSTDLTNSPSRKDAKRNVETNKDSDALNRAGFPLPPEARLDRAGIPPAQEEATLSWAGSLRPDNATAEERVPEIFKRGRIIVGVDQAQNLLSFRDTTTGELKGFEVDLAREISRDIFGDPNRVDFRFVESSMRTEFLENNDVDIVVRTMSVTKERLDKVQFSTPYLSSSVRLMVPKSQDVDGLAGLEPGATICVAGGTSVLDVARREAPTHPILRTRTWPDCLMALQQFQVGAIMSDETILAGSAVQDPLTRISEESYGAEQIYAVGIAKGNDGLVRQVNSTIERIRSDGTWDTMFSTWLGPHIANRPTPPARYREED
ncbi:glutamate ABC transporter substrate-binding protein [Corynebacterium aquatimens]|uniref:Polar amino acid transport system substrate-binding protein n=1 Tax=Corynebacterium aquatimens TaxID=1190508 RepID=A0A931E1W8_9CORY|nr:glutamate ABC transporter substrate-binding protein [Corynebacterium aquatimens]MBG6122392.1 polar amino acid transport system substrate-binding protein [Corynebacterium aquatimens]WJY65065.1 ABC transporter glutamine-binding protein GlnH precursor [Corynebacterium aquatimens]